MAAANFSATYQPTRVTQQAPVLTEHGSRVELIKNGFCPDCGFQLRKKIMFGRWKTLYEICPRESTHANTVVTAAQNIQQQQQQHGISAAGGAVPQSTYSLPSQPTNVPSVNKPTVPPVAAAAAQQHSHSIPSAPPVVVVPTVPLPPPCRRPIRPPTGGYCTAAFLRAVKASPSNVTLSWQGLLLSMVTELHEMGNQTAAKMIPTLTSGMLLNANDPMRIVPSGYNGKRRAILIGINYVTGQQSNNASFLSGSHQNVNDMKEYLVNSQGFEEKELLILQDDNNVHHPPTRQKLIDAFTAMAQYSSQGDVVFVYYSGRGIRPAAVKGSHGGGGGSTSLVPIDSNTAGFLTEKDIMKTLLEPMKAGVHSTLLFDCNNIDGMVLADLPYRLTSKSELVQTTKRSGGGASRFSRGSKKNFSCICLGLGSFSCD